MKKTETKILIEALEILSRDIESPDGVASACIMGGAERIRELSDEVKEREKNFNALKAGIEDIKREIEKVKLAEKMLFQVHLTINNCKHNEKNLPDSFDDQLCDGIEEYFKTRQIKKLGGEIE